MGCSDALAAVLFNYNTVKTVQIKNKTVSVVFRSLQLLIIGYIIGYAIIYEKGYQQYDNAVSSISTKVKGIGATCRLPGNLIGGCPPDQIRIWDTIDYVVPAEENNALFIVTNYVEVPNQVQGVWDEDINVTVPSCVVDQDCDAFKLNPSTNGLIAPNCSDSRCQIYAWGPVETKQMDTLAEAPDSNSQITQVENFTLFIKNNVLFPQFKVTFDNLNNGNITSSDLATCRWAPTQNNDNYCPIFQLQTIAQLAGVQNYSSILAAGAIIAIQAAWDCNLDDDTKHCAPTWSFSRLDDPTSSVSVGYNFRTGFYTSNDAVDFGVERTLSKFYGTRFVFTVSGVAAKFGIAPLIITIGSGVGILGVSTLICDFLVVNVVKHKEYYSAHKIESISEEDVYVVNQEEKASLLAHQHQSHA